MLPLVTVITPVYNCERYISLAIESVITQDYSNIEYIVVNDGSTDNTTKILERFKNIQIINQANTGEASAVNKGFSLANGKYIIILNADDLLLPKAISHLVDFMEQHPDLLLAYPNWDKIDHEDKVIEQMTSKEYDYTYAISHHYCFPSVGAIITKETIKTIGRNPAYKYTGDMEHYTRIGLYGNMARVPLTLACWRKWGGQASKEKGDRMASEHIRLIKSYYKSEYLPPAIIKVKQQAFCWANLVAAIESSGFNRMKYIVRGLSYYPWEVFFPANYKKLWRLVCHR